jgi:hypothetical protein
MFKFSDADVIVELGTYYSDGLFAVYLHNGQHSDYIPVFILAGICLF